MKKIIFLLLFFVILCTNEISADTLVIKDNGMSETILREHFSIQYVEPLFIDQNKLDVLLDRIEEQVYEPPTSAYLDDNENIVPAQPGLMLHRNKLKQQFYNYFYGNDTVQLTVPKKIIYQRVDSELLSEIRNYELGSFITYFNKNNKERANNIKLAAESINNHVVFPGEEFSFNKVVGKRTKDRGYLRAPVFIKGELAEDIGGGICQVSSTLFNAVALDGIHILERYSHSRAVPYVPPGRDATVSWWGPDFVFKNAYNHPILIRAYAENGRLMIRILSSESVERKKGAN